MDITLPVLDGIEATRQIVRELPDTKVIVLTAHDPETNDVQAVSAGAMGYLHKNTDPEELLKAVHTVANGELFLSPASTRRVLNKLHHGENGQASPDGVRLTERDKKLLRWLAQGLQDKEIAQELLLSESRVRNLLSALYAKLRVRGRAQAAAYAVEHKLT
jgi:DNA-binding NarL/FixJ family response regulator